MLSFDITDRHIRIIRGAEARGKIRVASAATIDVGEGLIINGHIKDIPKVATLINEALKANRMADKEAVISISSNLIIFKELHIPKAKGMQLLTMVQNQMQHTMGIADDYSISYTIAGEVEEEGVQALKVLATACPFEVVDCFRKMFSMLGIALRSIAVSCNCITRIILADNKIRNKMPVLVVQIDANFISLNLYEDGQLSFSRFATIDASDYDNSNDYIYEAVNENIFRMFQFHKSRGGSETIQNVIFYGDTTEYIRLTNALEQMDISTSLLSVPSQVGGYENFEFAQYANAIGAMFRRQKETERINLLEVDASTGRVSAGASFGVAVAATVGISALFVAAGWFFLDTQINNYKEKIEDIDTWLTSGETRDQVEKVKVRERQIKLVYDYRTNVLNFLNSFNTHPSFNNETIEKYREAEMEVMEGIEASEISYDTGVLSLKITYNNTDDPATVAENIYEADYFDRIYYNGYDEKKQEAEEELGIIIKEAETFFESELKMNLRPNNGHEIEILGEDSEVAAQAVNIINNAAQVEKSEADAAAAAAAATTEGSDAE